jgi:hypothetical protein
MKWFNKLPLGSPFDCRKRLDGTLWFRNSPLEQALAPGLNLHSVLPGASLPARPCIAFGI